MFFVFICDVGIPILCALVGFTQIILPIVMGEKLFWIVRPGGARMLDYKFRALIKSLENPNQNKK